MISCKSPTAVSLFLLAAVGGAGTATAQSGPHSSTDAIKTAQCILRNLPLGGQMYQGSDGSIRVRAMARRGITARWTISKTGTMTQNGGTAGLTQTLTEVCS